MIHGDVFRSPNHLNLFAAFVGSGAQIFSTVLLLLVCVLIGVFKATKRGALLTAFILIYAVCGVIGGIVAGRIFKQLKGKNWVWNVVLTASVFPLPLGVVFTWVNTIAWNRESTAALPFTTIMVSLPLHCACVTSCQYCPSLTMKRSETSPLNFSSTTSIILTGFNIRLTVA